MKKTILFTLGLAAAFAGNLFAGETLQLQLVPERGYIVKNSLQEIVIKIDLSAITDGKKVRRTPLNLAVVLDKSGSMTGAKIEKTKQAAMQLVDRLQPDDIFSLVIFSDEARVVVPAQHVENKAALKAKIEAIEAGGSTALYAGVNMGAGQIREYFLQQAHQPRHPALRWTWPTSAPVRRANCAGSAATWPNAACPSPPSASATITTRI